MITNAFTVDVESWCHASTQDFASLPDAEKRDGVMRGLDILLELLDRNECRATFFVLGSVAEAVPEVVRKLRDHEVGSHGFDHRRVDEMTPEGFEADLAHSKRVLEDITGRPIVAYRAPMWSLYHVRDWAFETLAGLGFRYDSSLFPVRLAGSSSLPRGPFDIRTPSGTVTEVPPLSRHGLLTRYPMGGTWGFRTFPYFDIRRAVRRTNRRGRPALFHLHPWELDPERPPLRQPFWTRIALTVRFTNLRNRIDRLLGDFPFGPLTGAVAENGRPTLDVKELS